MLKCKQSSTNPLHRHLTSAKHQLTKLVKSAKTTTNEWSNQQTLRTLGFEPTKKSNFSINEIITQLVIEGCTLNAICQKGLQYLLNKSGYANVPKSPTTIAAILKEQELLAKLNIKNIVRSYIDQGYKVSITMDEWSSISMKKYLSLIVHFGSTYFSIGLLQIKSEDSIFDLFKNKIEDFDIKLSDIIAVHSDGAHQMKTFARLNQECAFHSYCLVHAMHNAIKNTFYTEPAKANLFKDDNDIEENEEEEEESDSLKAFKDLDVDINSYFSMPELNEFLSTFRKVVKSLRRSHKRSEALQCEVIEFNNNRNESEKELEVECRLKVDTVHRFAYVYDMLLWCRRYKSPINALFDIDNKHWIILEEVLQILKPIKDDILKLSERDTNFLVLKVFSSIVLSKEIF